MRIIISTVGTSLLTNRQDHSNKLEKDCIRDTANLRQEGYKPEEKEIIHKLRDKAIEILKNGELEEARRASAEINGILGLYKNDLKGGKNDQHFLLSTDTYQGEVTAAIVKDYLLSQNLNCQTHTITSLNTQNKELFSEGVKNILKWCDETLEGYKASDYEIIFNLTGGFKSLQGCMNTVGMFYADRIVYIFESGNELLEIPRLPIELDKGKVKRFADKILLLEAGKNYSVSDFSGLPEAMIDEVYDSVLLSVWGKLVWNKLRHNFLETDLFELPFIVYEDSFRKDFRNYPKDKVKLQETLAKTSVWLEKYNGSTEGLKKDGGLLYEDYKNQRYQGIPIGHFRINQSERVSCYSQNGKLYLRHCGLHDYVNDNP